PDRGGDRRGGGPLPGVSAAAPAAIRRCAESPARAGSGGGADARRAGQARSVRRPAAWPEPHRRRGRRRPQPANRRTSGRRSGGYLASLGPARADARGDRALVALASGAQRVERLADKCSELAHVVLVVGGEVVAVALVAQLQKPVGAAVLAGDARRQPTAHGRMLVGQRAKREPVRVALDLLLPQPHDLARWNGDAVQP